MVDGVGWSVGWNITERSPLFAASTFAFRRYFLIVDMNSSANLSAMSINRDSSVDSSDLNLNTKKSIKNLDFGDKMHEYTHCCGVASSMLFVVSFCKNFAQSKPDSSIIDLFSIMHMCWFASVVVISLCINVRD